MNVDHNNHIWSLRGQLSAVQRNIDVIRYDGERVRGNRTPEQEQKIQALREDRNRLVTLIKLLT